MSSISDISSEAGNRIIAHSDMRFPQGGDIQLQNGAGPAPRYQGRSIIGTVPSVKSGRR